jgi:hypothetical protein
MIVQVKDHVPPAEAPGGRVVKPSVSEPPVASAADSRIDEMSDSSFPASDPPSAWTWEVKSPTSTAQSPTQR